MPLNLLFLKQRVPPLKKKGLMQLILYTTLVQLLSMMKLELSATITTREGKERGRERKESTISQRNGKESGDFTSSRARQ